MTIHFRWSAVALLIAVSTAVSQDSSDQFEASLAELRARSSVIVEANANFAGPPNNVRAKEISAEWKKNFEKERDGLIGFGEKPPPPPNGLFKAAEKGGFVTKKRMKKKRKGSPKKGNATRR